MASGVNKVILVGNLGADPEVRTTPSGQSVANLRVATTEYWNDKDGNKQERTEWHNVVVWGRSAEHCGQYLSKGRQVYVEGRLQSREYTDRDGNNRRVWDVVANSVVFLQGGSGGGGGGGGGGRAAAGAGAAASRAAAAAGGT
ncbi:MAG: single-stranded DNA-binding protein [Myxococcales bacterium]|nr:single-stranded DNA-binding protein [Myxococcales bacterium]